MSEQKMTKWVSGDVGITSDGEYFFMPTNQELKREVHEGRLVYRIRGSNKRLSWKKLNENKIKQQVEIKCELPF